MRWGQKPLKMYQLTENPFRFVNLVAEWDYADNVKPGNLPVKNEKHTQVLQSNQSLCQSINQSFNPIQSSQSINPLTIIAFYPLFQSLSQRSLVKRLRLPSLNFFKKENQDGVFKMSLSPSGKYLAVVHLSGKFSLWNMPSLKLMKMWDHSEQVKLIKTNQGRPRGWVVKDL